jgi:uridine kinase
MTDRTTEPRWQPLKSDVMDALATEILQNNARGKVIVAIDGVDGAGKTQFGDALADAIRRAGHEAVTASVDGFHRPRAERYAKGIDSPEGFFDDSYDYDAFETQLIAPFRAGEPFAVSVFDLEADAPEVRMGSAPSDNTILVIDGIFLHRHELRGLWNYSVWLDVSDAERDRRLIERDGERSVAPRYSKGQELYVRRAKPRAAATAIYNNNDFEHPKRIFADAC